MKPLFFLTIILTGTGCANHTANNLAADKCDTIVKHDTVYLSKDDAGSDWQLGFGLTHDPEKDSVWGKPVSYYLKDKDCSAIAFDFYHGYMRPTDNGATRKNSPKSFLNMLIPIPPAPYTKIGYLLFPTAVFMKVKNITSRTKYESNLVLRCKNIAPSAMPFC